MENDPQGPETYEPQTDIGALLGLILFGTLSWVLYPAWYWHIPQLFSVGCTLVLIREWSK